MTRSRLILALRLVAVTGVAVMAVVLGIRLTHHTASVAPKVDKGVVVPAPTFSLPRLNGAGKLALASLRGKAVVLNFWASDCLPCKREMPRIEAAARRYSGRAVVVGIDVEDAKGPARAFLERYGATYPVVYDPNGVTLAPYGVAATPQTFFVDRRGRLVPPHILGPASAEQLAAGIGRALKT